MLTAFLAFAGAGALIVLLPGPDTLVVLRNVLLLGKRHGAMTALGVLTGLTIWVTAAAIGLTALLRASHDGYLALRLVGAAYLVWIGIQALRAKMIGQDPDESTARKPLVGRGYRAGLATDLLNPKVGIFCITFMPAFIPSGAPVAPVTLGFGAIFIVETALYFAGLLLFVDRLNRWMHQERSRRRLNRATGVVLIGFGLRLATEG